MFTTTTATAYVGINGYVGNDHTSYIVKLGGVILTGGTAYTIASSGPLGEEVTEGITNVGKVVLSTAPTAGYELEVRALQIGASAVPTAGTLVVPLMEAVNVGSAAGGVMNLDLNTKQVYLFNSDATADFTLNLRADVGTALNALVGVGNSISTTIVLRQGSSLKSLTAVKIDNTAVTVQWQNNVSTMTASKLNVISLTAIKTAADTYTVLGSVTTVGA